MAGVGEVGWDDFMGYLMGYDGIYHGVSLVYYVLNNGVK